MSDPTPLPFEEALRELDVNLRDLEDGTTSLEVSLARYERGVALLRGCYGQLKVAEQRVRLLAGNNADGEPEFQPFNHASSINSTNTSVPGAQASPKSAGISG